MQKNKRQAIVFTKQFQKNLLSAPLIVQKTFAKQLGFLEQDLRHPSLHAKKYDETNDIWQARVNRNWRFYFMAQDSTYYLVNIKAHPK